LAIAMHYNLMPPDVAF